MLPLLLCHMFFRNILFFVVGRSSVVTSQNSKEDVFASWVDHVISTIVSTFAREGSLDRAFLDVYPSLDWGVLTSEEDIMICSEYDGCVIPFYWCIFSILGLRLPFNSSEMEVFNHLMISPL